MVVEVSYLLASDLIRALGRYFMRDDAERFRSYLVDSVIGRIEGLLKDYHIVILATCGCLRGLLASRLSGRGVKVLVYEKLAKQPYAKGLEKLEYKDVDRLAKIVAKGVEESGRLVVVLENTTEALYLKEYCEKGLKEYRVKVVILPIEYGDVLRKSKEWGERLGRLEDFEVDYTRIGGSGKGVPPGPLCAVIEGRVSRDEVINAKKAIEELSPGVLGFKEAFKRTSKFIPMAIATGVASSIADLLVGPTVISIVLTSFSTPAVRRVFPIEKVGEEILNFIGMLLPPSLRSAIREIMKKFSEHSVAVLIKRREPRNEFMNSITKLLRTVINAQKYVDNEVYEAYVDKVAAEWGLAKDEFRNFINNLYNLVRGRVVTEEDLKKSLWELEKKLRNWVEDRFRELEKRIEEIEKQVRELRCLAGLYKEPEDLGIDLDNNRLKVLGTEYSLIKSGKFEKWANEIEGRIKRPDFVVVKGPKGIGKSVLIRYVLADMLREEAHFALSVSDVASEIEKLDSLANIIDENPGIAIIFYDPSPLIYYERREQVYLMSSIQTRGEDIDKNIRYLRALQKSHKNTACVIVLPDDMFEALRKDTKEMIKDGVVEIDLRQEDFIEDIIKGYSNSTSPIIKRLAKLIAEEYSSGGYTLIARYVGEWLRQSGGRAEDIERALMEGAGNAKKFLKYYITEVVFGGSSSENFRNRVMSYGVQLIAHALLGELPEGLGRYDILRVLRGEAEAFALGPELTNLWVVKSHEDLLEEALRELVFQAIGLEEDDGTFEEFKEPIREVWRIISDIEFDEKNKKVIFRQLKRDVDLRWAGELYIENISALIKNRKISKEFSALTLYLLITSFLVERLRDVKDWEVLYKYLVAGYYDIPLISKISRLGKLKNHYGQDISSLLLNENDMPISIKYIIRFGGLPFLLTSLLHVDLCNNAERKIREIREKGICTVLDAYEYLAYSLPCNNPYHLAKAVSLNLVLLGKAFYPQVLADIVLPRQEEDEESQVPIMLMLYNMAGHHTNSVAALTLKYILQNQRVYKLNSISIAILSGVFARMYSNLSTISNYDLSLLKAFRESALKLLELIKGDEKLYLITPPIVYCHIAQGDMTTHLGDPERYVEVFEDNFNEIRSKLDECLKDVKVKEYLREVGLKPERYLEWCEAGLRSLKAWLKFNSGEFEEARKEFGKASEIHKKLGYYGDYYVARSHSARSRILLGDIEGGAKEIIEMSMEEDWWPTIISSSDRPAFVSNIIISGALLGENFKEVLNEFKTILHENPSISTLTYLLLYILTGEEQYYKTGIEEVMQLMKEIEVSPERETIYKAKYEKSIISHTNEARCAELLHSLRKPWLLLEDTICSLILVTLLTINKCFGTLKNLSEHWKNALNEKNKLGSAKLWENLYEASIERDLNKVRDALIKLYYFNI